jgi:HlyD family secretion protein
MDRTRVAIILTVGAVALGGGWHHFHASADPVQLVTAEVAAGDIVQAVACTGTLDAVTTIDVGSEVSGTISSIPVDFNSIVHKGDVLAKLDTSDLKAQLDQARASLSKSMADVGVAQAAVTDATEKLDRSKVLAARQLIPQSDLDTAQVTEDEARASLKSAVATQGQAQASVDQANVNLEHAVILSPIDGIVVARKVDVGQTVAASFQTPSLFSIAADLTKMKLTATVDEADIGSVTAGQVARFTVDAYPSEPFYGKVIQVRLQPETVQNVVSYDTVIVVDNTKLLLKPGMTATVTIEVARHENVPRIPTSALRFRPTQSVMSALNETKVVTNPKIRPAAALTPGVAAEAWVVNGDRLEPRLVRVGLSDGQSVEVLSGLTVGARVVTAAWLTSSAKPVAGPSPSPLAPQPMYMRRF